MDFFIAAKRGGTLEISCYIESCHPEPVEGRIAKDFALKRQIFYSVIQRVSSSALRQAQDDNLRCWIWRYQVSSLTDYNSMSHEIYLQSPVSPFSPVKLTSRQYSTK